MHGNIGNTNLDANALIGAWQLESCTRRSTSGEERRPYGERPMGQLVYAASGHMAVVLARRDRPRFASADLAAGSDAEIRAAFLGLEAYAGTWSLDAAAGTVTHHLDISRHPSWEGATQLRHVRLDGDRLELSTPPIHAGGRDWVYTLVWRRAPALVS